MGATNDWLLAHGHTNGGMCEKCWREAGILTFGGGSEYESKTEAYHALMAKAERDALAAMDAAEAAHKEA
jgi:hypothetical protein